MGAKAMSFAVLQGAWSFLTTVVGIWLGILFLLLLDKAVPHLHLAARWIIPALPYLLSFAAGAMIYVVVEELIPEMSQGKHSNLCTVCFSLEFTLMLALDVALG